MFIAANHQRAIKISRLHGFCFNIEQSLNCWCLLCRPLYSHRLLRLLFRCYTLFQSIFLTFQPARQQALKCVTKGLLSKHQKET